MSHSSYMSKGIMPSLVGWALGIVGLVSTASSMLGTSIIDTPMGNGGDSVASMAVLGAGIAINYSRSTVAAWLGIALAVALLYWAGVNFNTKQAVRIAEATATAAKAAAAASGNVVATVAENEPTQSTPSPKQEMYRLLTPNEVRWCKTHKSESPNCINGACPISTCGAVGK